MTQRHSLRIEAEGPPNSSAVVTDKKGIISFAF